MVVAISFLGVSDLAELPLVRVPRRRARRRAGPRDRRARPRRRHPGQAGDRRRRRSPRRSPAGPPAVLLTDRATMETFRFWQVGTVGGRGLDVLLTGLPFLVLGAVLALPAPALLDSLALGDDLARGLGGRTGRRPAGPRPGGGAARRRRDRAGRSDRLRRAGRSRTPCASSSAPGTRRAPAAQRGRTARCWSSLADTAGRVVLPPAEVQVGIMTAVVGVPVFLVLRAARPDGRPVMAALAVLEPDRPPARPGPVRRAPPYARAARRRLVVAGLSLALLLGLRGPGAARGLHLHDPRLLPDPVRGRHPGRDVHPHGGQAAPRGARRVLVGARVRGRRRDLPDHAAQPAGQPRHHRGQPRRQRGAVVAIVVLGPGRAGRSSLAAVVGAVVRRRAGRPGGRRRHGTGYRLVLVGSALAAALQSVIQYLFTRADVYDAQLVLRWLTGSVSGADWPTIRLLARWCCSCCCRSPCGGPVAAGRRARRRRRRRARRAGRAGPTCCCCSPWSWPRVAVAAAGPVAFVAFLAGPIARALNGGRTTLLGAGLVGAIIVVAADYVGRLPAGRHQLPRRRRHRRARGAVPALAARERPHRKEAA